MPEDLDRFRVEYRGWLDANVPVGWQDEVAGDRHGAVALARRWMRALHAGGWAAPGWPPEHGGMGATLAQQIVMYEEDVAAGAPDTGVFRIAISHAGTTLVHHGTDDQRAAHLPRILDGEEIWCQGFSEPNAGSDLASLSTRAVRDGDRYVVNGQKVWSSMATDADWCLLLARTDPLAPKRKGISYFLLDLRSPGVEIRPLRQLSGNAEFCEIFLTDVSIPASNLVGAENDGWRISQTTLSAERGPFFLPNIRRLQAQADEALALLGTSIHDDAAARDVLGRDYAEAAILAELYGQILDTQVAGAAVGPESSIIKLCFSEIVHRLTADVVELLGPSAQLGEPLTPDDDRGGTWELDHLASFGWLIGGGTSEIQRNLIGERVLGLPREPELA